MSSTSYCPCDGFSFPEVISNVPGLSSIAYRVGDFTAFRDAMLQSLPGEVELANWKPTTTSDLALQMIEWWAYLADILTFYNERIANQDYLGTADQNGVRNLVSVLGYRPRPGIGATATLAALVKAAQAITLPQGMAVQSKPGPGLAPQIFELLQNTAAQPGGSISCDPDNSAAHIGQDGSILLEGTISSIKIGELLLLVRDGWDGTDFDYVLGNVLSIQPQVSPRGRKYTQVFLSSAALPMPSGGVAPVAANYRLMRSSQIARLFQYGVSIDTSLIYNTGSPGQADLDSVTRLIQPGDMVLFDSLNGQTGGAFQGSAAPAPPAPTESSSSFGLSEEFGGFVDPVNFDLFAATKSAAASASAPAAPAVQSKIEIPSFEESTLTGILAESGFDSGFFNRGGGLGPGKGPAKPTPPPVPASMYLASVQDYTEIIWYADNPTDVTKASAAGAGIPVLHSEITFNPSVSAPSASTLVVRYGWQDVGVVIPPFATTFDGYDGAEDLLPVVPPEFPAEQILALLQDQNGAGALVNGTVVPNPAGLNSPGELQLTDTLQGTADLPLNPELTPPINVLTNLLPFTRGKTVTNEVLGSGDATQTGQVFTLAKSPLTYLTSAQSTSGGNYSSTLRVWVNGVQWHEQPSFYGQPPNAMIFVTREDDNQVTSVQFGDGVNGARLPSGANNVTASYRYGSGSLAPAAGTLTVINTPQPGLASIQNPVAAGGGADPEPSSQMRKYAPLSVLTLGRAISGEDYEAIAISTPGVNRASAIWNFDPAQQRTVVTVYVGDTTAAQSAAELVLSGDADPNRPVTVLLANPVPLTITLNLVVDPNYDGNAVATQAVTALTDPNTGLFGSSLGIGQSVFRSQIYAACLSIPGAMSVHSLTVNGVPAGTTYRYDPGPGNYFTLSPTYGGTPPIGLQITPEAPNG